MSDQFRFLKPFLRGWIIIIAAMIFAYGLSSKYLSYVTPLYESTAKLRLADLHEGVPNSNLFKDFDVFASTQKIQAEIELIKSHTIIKKALQTIPFGTVIQRKGDLKNTELFSDAPLQLVNVHLEAKYWDKAFHLQVPDTSRVIITAPDGLSIQGKIGDTLKIGNSTLLVNLNRDFLRLKPNSAVMDQYLVTFCSPAAQIAEVLKHLDVTSVDKDVPVIRISYKSAHPEKAALFPNALAQAYITDYIESKFGAAEVTSDFLNDRIQETNQKLTGTESAILNYRERNDITNIQQETETDLRKVAQLKIQQTNLKMSLDAIKELDHYMEKGKDNFLDLAPNFEAFTDLLSTEMIKKIKQLQAEKKDLLLIYTPKDERVASIDKKIDDISSYLRESIRNTRKNLQSKYENLSKDIVEAEKVFVPVPEQERVMTVLNREFEIYQQSYIFLNQKKIEAEIAKAAKVAFHRIITPSSISKVPVSPNRIIIKGVSVILGMLTAIVLIFIVHSLKARVNDLSTVEANSSIPIIAAVPLLKKPALKDQFFLKTITQWQVKGLLQPNGILCFTGFDASHGVHFIATEIIHQLQRQGRKILVVEISPVEPKDGFSILQTDATRTARLFLNLDLMKYQTTDTIQTLLLDHAQGFDQTLILNTNFGEAFTLANMALASLNVVCIDTRLTPAKKIMEVDLLQAEYPLSALHFAINRVGYNPSVIREAYRTLLNVFKR